MRWITHFCKKIYPTGIYMLSVNKGAGGVDDPGKVKIELSVVPDRGEC